MPKQPSKQTSRSTISEAAIYNIFSAFEELDPAPKTELHYTNNYTLLVAVVLSARMTDKGVNKATPELFDKYDTPAKMLDLGIEGLKSYIKTVGLYPTKAKNIISLSEILLEDYDSIVPDSIEELIKLPGVGRKTANVVLNSAFGMATMPVDTHVQRVSNRLGLTCANTPDKIEQDLLKVIPTQWLFMAHHWLVLHGRYICKSRSPECAKCPVSEWCDYRNKIKV
ncbi:MAG: endonuclease III [Pseudomonadota bacterium]